MCTGNSTAAWYGRCAYVVSVILFTVFFASSGKAIAARADTPLTVCKVAENSMRYNGAEIRIRARVQSGGAEGEFLADTNCVGSVIRFANEGTRYDRADVANLRKQVHKYDGEIATKPLQPTVWATVYGIFLVDVRRPQDFQLRVLGARNIVVRDATPLSPTIKPHR